MTKRAASLGKASEVSDTPFFRLWECMQSMHASMIMAITAP
ncbi:MAG: hypothetical protein ACSLFK_08220 [Gemmatimonadaceae bacterium]